MAFLDSLNLYFAGEKAQSLFFILPAGLLCLIFAGVVFQSERGGFMWGVGLPFVAIGLLLVGVGAGVGLRTDGQVAELTALSQGDVSAFLAQELPRMAAVNRNWTIFFATWTTFIAVGLGLRFGLGVPWARGLGISLIFLGGLGLVIDEFASRRAVPYTEALARLAESDSGSTIRPPGEPVLRGPSVP